VKRTCAVTQYKIDQVVATVSVDHVVDLIYQRVLLYFIIIPINRPRTNFPPVHIGSLRLSPYTQFSCAFTCVPNYSPITQRKFIVFSVAGKFCRKPEVNYILGFKNGIHDSNSYPIIFIIERCAARFRFGIISPLLKVNSRFSRW